VTGGHVQRRWLQAAGAIAVVALAAASCDGGGGGGLTVPQNDSSPPEVTLQVSEAAPGSPTVSVTTSGTDQNLALQQRTGPLNLVASAKDPESGIQDTQIWVNKVTTSCDPTTCTTAGPGLLGAPRFSSPSPKKNPGDTGATASSILAQSLNLAFEIPAPPLMAGDSFTVTIQAFARAINNLNGTSETKLVQATFRQP